MQDALTLCENCEQNPSISVTDDEVELCAACELALIDEMAAHSDDCACILIIWTMAAIGAGTGADCAINSEQCTCGVLGRVERRKLWLRSEIAKAAK